MAAPVIPGAIVGVWGAQGLSVEGSPCVQSPAGSVSCPGGGLEGGKRGKKPNRVGADQSIDAVRATWHRCLFFMESKQRFCNIARSAGSDFCGNHRAEGDPVPSRVKARAAAALPKHADGATSSNKAAVNSVGLHLVERIPCPIDPSHTVYRHDLAVHLRTCNVTKRDEMMKQQPFYRENCNIGGSATHFVAGKGAVCPMSHGTEAVAVAASSACAGEHGGATKCGDDNIDADDLLRKIERCYNSFAYCEADGLLWRLAGESASGIDVGGEVGHPGSHAPQSPSSSDSLQRNEYVPGPECSSITSRVMSAVCGEASTFDKVRHVRQDVELVHRMLECGLIRNEVYTDACFCTAAQHTDKKSRAFVGCGKDWSSECGRASEGMESRMRSLDTSFRHKSVAVIELGAGRGMLGLSVMCALTIRDGVRNSQQKSANHTNSSHPDALYRNLSPGSGPLNTYSCGSAQLILVERNGLRNKADRVLRDRNYNFARVRLDLRHCVLSRLPGVDNRLSSNVVVCARSVGRGKTAYECSSSTALTAAAAAGGDTNSEAETALSQLHSARPNFPCEVILVAKHLCGVATDYSLLSVQSFSDPRLTSNGDVSTAEGTGPRHMFRGAAIATCCHHACRWSDYAGRAWLQQEHGFTEAEFNVMKQWSGWAHTLRVGRGQNAVAPRTAKASPPCKKRKSGGSAMSDPSDGTGGDSAMVLEEMKTTGDVNSGISYYNESNSDRVGQGEYTGGQSLPDAGQGEGEEEEVEREHAIPAMSSGTPRPAGLSFAEMARIGKMVKRVIDQGRVEYLRSLQLGAITNEDTGEVDDSSHRSGSRGRGGGSVYRWRQVQYCDPSLSPECFAIIGGERHSSSNK